MLGLGFGGGQSSCSNEEALGGLIDGDLGKDIGWDGKVLLLGSMFWNGLWDLVVQDAGWVAVFLLPWFAHFAGRLLWEDIG